MPSGRCSRPEARARDCVARWKLSRKRPGPEAARFRVCGLEDKMRIDVLTLFPEMFVGPLDFSMVKRARDTGILNLRVINLRDYTHDRHKTVDDKPFGGGPGMLLKPEPIFEAVESLAGAQTRVVLMTPAGREFDQSAARDLAQREHVLFLCGAYEGFDERVRTLAH